MKRQKRLMVVEGEEREEAHEWRVKREKGLMAVEGEERETPQKWEAP